MASVHPHTTRGKPEMFGDRYSDLLIICDKYQWLAHQVLVCNGSKYFTTKANLAHIVNGKYVAVVDDGTDAATVLRFVYWFYHMTADNDDNNLQFQIINSVNRQKISPSMGSYGLQEPQTSIASSSRSPGAYDDLINLEEAPISSDVLTVLADGMERLKISSPVFIHETMVELWAYLRLHRAALAFGTSLLAEECIEKISNTSRGAAYSDEFVKFVRTLLSTTYLDITQDGPARAIAAECATNIQFLMDSQGFVEFLRERDGFSYLIIQKLAETRLADTDAGERPQLLLTSSEHPPRADSISDSNEVENKYKALTTQLSHQLDAAKVDAATKDEQMAELSRRLDQYRQDLADADDRSAQLTSSVVVPSIRRKGRGHFTDLDEISTTDNQAIAIMDHKQNGSEDPHSSQAKRIYELEARVSSLTKELNQSRLGRDDYRTKMMKVTDALDKENTQLKAKLNRDSAMAVASAERIVKLEETNTKLKARNEAAAFDVLENNDLRSNVNGLNLKIAAREAEIVRLKFEVATKEEIIAKMSAVPAGHKLSLKAPPSECAIQSASPSLSATTIASYASAAPSSHGGVETFIDKKRRIDLERQIAAGLVSQSALSVPQSPSTCVSPTTQFTAFKSPQFQYSGVRASPVVHQLHSNGVQAPYLSRTNGTAAAQPTQSSGMPATQRSQTNGTTKSENIQTNDTPLAQPNKTSGFSPITPSPTTVHKNEENVKPSPKVDPPHRKLAPHHAAAPGVAPKAPDVSIAGRSTQEAVEIIGLKKQLMASQADKAKVEAEKAKIEKALVFSKRQLADARTGPMPNPVSQGRPGAGSARNNWPLPPAQTGFSKSPYPSSKPAEYKPGGMVGALRAIGTDYKACNDCGFDIKIQFRGVTEDQYARYLACRCTVCDAEVARWNV